MILGKIIQIAAGGEEFFALDDLGNTYIWVVEGKPTNHAVPDIKEVRGWKIMKDELTTN